MQDIKASSANPTAADGASLAGLLEFPWVGKEKLEKYGEASLAFARLMVAGTIENIKTLDRIIRTTALNWDFTRIKKVELAVLRISAYSLFYQKDISPSIVIEEAVGLCMEFGGDDSYRFVNGILDKIAKSMKKEVRRAPV
jgi:N utilization substance protein B